MIGYISLFFQFIIRYQNYIWLILCAVLCILILIRLLHFQIKPTVKITNFTFTYILIVIYISFYIAFFFFMRIYQIGSELDLKLVKDKYLVFICNFGETSLFLQIMISLLFFILILIWMIIFIRLKKLLEFKLWQMFFYYKNIWQIKTPKKFRQAWAPYLMWKYEKVSFDTFALKIYHLLFKITKKRDYFIPSHQLLFKVKKSIQIFFFVILIVLVLIECLINNFVLFYTFYYLTIYILMIMWMKIGLAIDEEVPYLEEILIERAYGEPNILYINLTKEEEFLLELCITYPQKAIEIGRKTEMIPWEILRFHPIYYYKRFVLTNPETLGYSKDNIIYFNKYRGLYFLKKDLEIENGKYYVNEEIQN